MPHPDQPIEAARRFLFETATGTTLYFDFAVVGAGPKEEKRLILKTLDTTEDSVRQQFRVWITGHIQSVENQGGDLGEGYLTRRKVDGRNIVLLESYHGNDQNQIWNFVPGAWRPRTSLGDNEMYTAVTTSHDPRTLKPDPDILQAMGDGKEVELVGWGSRYADPWTHAKGILVPLNQSWNCPEI